MWQYVCLCICVYTRTVSSTKQKLAPHCLSMGSELFFRGIHSILECKLHCQEWLHMMVENRNLSIKNTFQNTKSGPSKADYSIYRWFVWDVKLTVKKITSQTCITDHLYRENASGLRPLFAIIRLGFYSRFWLYSFPSQVSNPKPGPGNWYLVWWGRKLDAYFMFACVAFWAALSTRHS